MATYTIIGGDQKTYGSVAADDVRKWIADGRLNAQSLVRAEGEVEWRPLAAFPEFADALAARAALSGVLPPLPGAPAAPVRTSGLAVSSLILGILGIFTCGITALFGLILGAIALVQVKRSQGRLSGGGMALAGTIVSGIFLLLLPVYVALMLPALAVAKQKAQTINCANNLKQLAAAVQIYSADHKEQLPPAATWCDAIRSHASSGKIFQCPAGNRAERCHYAFNAKLGGMDISKVNPDAVMIFETEGGWNVSGGPELMLKRPRHGRVFVIAFADGHVEQLTGSKLDALRWDP
jgi:prepilin-type processing-associated H-X9-DG protein